MTLAQLWPPCEWFLPKKMVTKILFFKICFFLVVCGMTSKNLQWDMNVIGFAKSVWFYLGIILNVVSRWFVAVFEGFDNGVESVLKV